MHRWNPNRALLLAVSLVLIFGELGSAYTVSPFIVDPNESLPPCTLVNVTFTIDNPQPDANGFPDAVDLKMSSELYSSTWSLSLLTDEGQKIVPTRKSDHASLSEWNISGISLNSSHETIHVVLSGYAPEVEHTEKRTIIILYQMDKYNNPINGSNRSVQPFVINTCCIHTCNPNGYLASLTSLQAFRDHINESASQGIDISSAEAKYNEAQQKIAAASVLPANQYAKALNELNAARAAIGDGEKALDKASAEKSVADAQIPLQLTSQIIGWYKGNRSTAYDENLPAIIAQRDLAAGALSSANDAIANGNYSQARAKALDAYLIANTSYNKAVRCHNQLTCCYDPVHTLLRGSGAVFVGIGIAAIVLLIAGIIWWKKR